VFLKTTKDFQFYQGESEDVFTSFLFHSCIILYQSQFLEIAQKPAKIILARSHLVSDQSGYLKNLSNVGLIKLENIICLFQSLLDRLKLGEIQRKSLKLNQR